MKTICDRLRARREALDITQAELGRMAGVSRQAISLIESGTVTAPTIDTVAALAKALLCDFEWLATGEGRKPRTL